MAGHGIEFRSMVECHTMGQIKIFRLRLDILGDAIRMATYMTDVYVADRPNAHSWLQTGKIPRSRKLRRSLASHLARRDEMRAKILESA
jgi:hypothetical protein